MGDRFHCKKGDLGGCMRIRPETLEMKEEILPVKMKGDERG